MRKSYLTLKRILLSLAATYLEKGDILVYDAAAKINNLTIYRGGDLIRTITHSQIGVTALIHAGVLEELTGAVNPAAAKAVVAKPVLKPALSMIPASKPTKPGKPIAATPPSDALPDQPWPATGDFELASR